MTQQKTQSLTRQKLVFMTMFWMVLVVAGIFWVAETATQQDNSPQYSSMTAVRRR